MAYNLGVMLVSANLYQALWRPHMLHPEFTEMDDEAEDIFEQQVIMYAKDIIESLETGLKKLKEDPAYYKNLDSHNGWGTYKHFISFVE